MVKNEEHIDGFHIRSVVIPNGIISRHDADDEYQPTISNVQNLLANTTASKSNITCSIRNDIANVPEMVWEISKMIHSDTVKSKSIKNIGIIFDRVNRSDNQWQPVTVFACTNWSEFDQLQTNYFISFDFEVSHDDSKNVVRCWLTFGMGQRLRFYPEHSVWIIPTLFARSTTMTNYEVVQSLYDDEYKHGWRVALDDEIFNKYYHIITGYEHISNNYNRDEVKEVNLVQKSLRDELESDPQYDSSGKLNIFVEKQAYDSDTIIEDILHGGGRINVNDSNIMQFMKSQNADLRNFKFAIFRFENIECKMNEVRNIDDCKHVDTIIRNLQKFRDCDLEVDAVNVTEFNVESIIQAFDHIIKVHGFLSDDVQRVQIRQYIADHVKCQHGADCKVLKWHSNRARERESLEEKTQELPHEVDSLCEVVADALHSVHCYVVHQEQHLYRLTSDRNRKFETRFAAAADMEATDEKEDDDELSEAKEDDTPLGLNFGLSVLRWLPFGIEPHFDSLKPEILKNPDSTIDVPIFNHFLMICIAKTEDNNYTVKEMMSLKLYSDTTDLQALLRKAHWAMTEEQVRQAYYQWAKSLYETHLYHARPIPKGSSSKTTPCKLYHGLSRVFTMNTVLPMYNGPFSTTIAKDVARTFCKEQGLFLMIQSSYANPLKQCIGIQMECISSFKHEREVLLYNQHLPIQKTEIMDDDPTILMNHFLYSLHSRELMILKKETFYKKLGVGFDDKWIPSIMEHKLLFAKSKCKDFRVIDRLRNELDIGFFQFTEMFSNAVRLENDHVVLKKLYEFHDVASQLAFAATLGQSIPNNVSQEYRFVDIENFAISYNDEVGNNYPFGEGSYVQLNRGRRGFVRYFGREEAERSVSAPILEQRSQVVLLGIELDQSVANGHDGTLNDDQHFKCRAGHGIYVHPDEVIGVLTSLDSNVYCKRADDSFGYARIHSCILDRYIFRKNCSISISKGCELPLVDNGTDRRIHIQSVSDISVLQNVVINGNGTQILKMGGTVRLISKGQITNSGKLCCNGSRNGKGGDIYIVADSFVNEGKIECVPDGRIRIYCKEYINNGTIIPNPEVIKPEVVSNDNLVDYPVSVIDYFMHSLLQHQDDITTPKTFHKKIGVQVTNEWIPLISEHNLLFSVTRSGETLIEILRSELGLQIRPRGDLLLNEVSVDDIMGQMSYGLESFDRMRKVIQHFSNEQLFGADKLQEIYLKLPPTYKKMDGMKDFADISALAHELILQTVYAQRRMADFLVKDVVPTMHAHLMVCNKNLCDCTEFSNIQCYVFDFEIIQEKEQQIQRIKYDRKQAPTKLRNAVKSMEKASNLAKIAAEKAKKQYGTPRINRKSKEASYLKAKKAQEAYAATVMAANYEQDTYSQNESRFKQHCKNLDQDRLRCHQKKMEQFVNAHRQYFGNESIMLLQTRIMSGLDAFDPDREYDRYLKRTIQRNKSNGNIHRNLPDFVMRQYDYQNVFHSLQDSWDITRKLMPNSTRKVPLIVTVLCDKVKQLNGFETEGIFRKSAMATEIERLKGKLVRDDYMLDTRSPHVAACLLKVWLRGLRDSLIPQTHYDMAIDMAKRNTVKQESLEVFLSQLPEVNRETIKYLVKFLQELIEEKNVPKTKMNLENVAIVFGPKMLKCPHSDTTILLANSRFEKSFVMALIGELQDY